MTATTNAASENLWIAITKYEDGDSAGAFALLVTLPTAADQGIFLAERERIDAARTPAKKKAAPVGQFCGVHTDARANWAELQLMKQNDRAYFDV